MRMNELLKRIALLMWLGVSGVLTPLGAWTLFEVTRSKLGGPFEDFKGMFLLLGPIAVMAVMMHFHPAYRLPLKREHLRGNLRVGS